MQQEKTPGNSPPDPDALLRQGVALYQAGRPAKALACFDGLAQLRPRLPVAHFYRGQALYNLGRFDLAVAGYDRAIALRPDFAEAFCSRGNAFFRLKRPDAAVASYDRAIAIKPDYAEAHSNRGYALLELGRAEDALASCAGAIALNSDYAEAYINQGNALLALKRPEEALASYDRAVALRPGLADGHLNRGKALEELRRLDEGLASCERAIELNPGYAPAYVNRGIICKKLLRLEDALASYDRAIALKPDYPQALFSRGLVLVDLKRLDEALASYDRAIALYPDYAEARWAKSNLTLLMGDYEQGWQLQEWRLKGGKYKSDVSGFDKPRWPGKNAVRAAGRAATVLVYADAGLGDAIQYSRYVPMMKDLGVRVVLEAPAPLLGLMSTLGADAVADAQDGQAQDCDYYYPLGSLPLAFGTTLQSVPARVPYLSADPARVDAWQKKLGPRTKPRIGLAWSGQANRNIDSAPATNRSIPLEWLRPLFDLPCEFHSLQKDVRPEDAATLAALKSLADHRADINDFSDTAALAANLDLVISIDTSVAHLAGALGRAVWVMLPFSTDYRWTFEGGKTPWYPTATLFRQQRIGDWAGVVSQVADQLRKLR